MDLFILYVDYCSKYRHFGNLMPFSANKQGYSKKERDNFLVIPHKNSYVMRKSTQDSGSTFTNKGASAAITFTLPPSESGLVLRFYVTEAYNLILDPYGTETIAGLTGLQGSAGDYLYSNVPNAYVEIKCEDAGAWQIRKVVGNWVNSAQDPAFTYIGLEPTLRIITDTTLNANHRNIFADTDGGAITVTLPAGITGTYYRIANTGTSENAVTLTPNGAELLLGENSNYTLLDGDVLIIVFEETEGWF